MRLLLPLLVLVVTACTADQPPDQPQATSGSGQSSGPKQAEPTVVQPADAPPRSSEDILGAVPGPCNSPLARPFLGKPFTPDLLPRLKAATGAAEVVVRDGTNPNLPPLDRRLNVMLSNSGRIVLFDCG